MTALLMVLGLFVVIGLNGSFAFAERLGERPDLVVHEKASNEVRDVFGGQARSYALLELPVAWKDQVWLTHTDPYLTLSHGQGSYHAYRHSQVPDGGALMFSWAFCGS